MSARVGIILGSDSDLPVMKKSCDILQEFGVSYEIVISSAHRVPHETAEWASSAAERGIEVIIAAAGMAAHLPGVVAAHTHLPVIGVPLKSAVLDGVDALYSIVQMPSGVPVATVAINGAKNAAYLALQILALKYDDIRQKVDQFKSDMAKNVRAKNEKLQKLGVAGYLKTMNK